jgi:putative transposase
MVTCGTYLKQQYFRGDERLRSLCDALLTLAEKYGWNLQAWAVFSNHYHLVAVSPPHPANLETFMNELHSRTSAAANEGGRTPGRRVWYQYWDTHLTYQKSYFARLSYVHRNAVHHGLVEEPSLYPWCSAGWFQRRASAAFYKSIMRFGTGRVKVPDDFEVLWLPGST